MARRKRKEQEITLNIKGIDPSRPGSYKMAKEALLIWDAFQDLADLLQQASVISRSLEHERSREIVNEERVIGLERELAEIERKARKLAIDIQKRVDTVIARFVDVKGGNLEDVLDHLSLEQAKKIVQAVIGDPFSFLEILVPEEIASGTEEHSS